MAGVTTYTCTKCRPIDTEIIQAYEILTNTSKLVSEQEADRVTAEQGRVAAENERERVFGLDHGTATDDHATAVSDHGIAGDDHLLAVADHGTAGDDHTLAAGDHVTAGEDHLASTAATSRANDAAAAAEHMVDIHTGPAGADGADGKSAYELAVEEGYTGTEEEWLASLHGADGTDGTDGTDGKSAYEIAVDEGFVGTEEQWLASLKGEQGNTGSSVDYPYELVNNRTTDDATKGLSAAEGKRLGDDLSQLEAKVGEPTEMIVEVGQLILDVLKKAVYKDADADDAISALESKLSEQVVSIDAVYTQPGTIYAGQPLDTLLDGLVVTANYAGGTSQEVTEFELSGTLTTGTSTIIVEYGGKTDTFSVVVTDCVYYVPGTLFANQVGLRNGFTSSNIGNAATIDGVTYYFTRSGTKDSGAKKRASYYLFDLLLNEGESYKYQLKINGLGDNDAVSVGVQSFDETLHLAGVANSSTPINLESHYDDSGWMATTKNGDVIEFTFTQPSGSVGNRITFKLVRSGSEINIPSDFQIAEMIIASNP